VFTEWIATNALQWLREEKKCYVYLYLCNETKQVIIRCLFNENFVLCEVAKFYGCVMPMTHVPETGTENPYQFSAGVSYESVSIFSGTKIWYGVEQCSTPCRKLVRVFGTGFWYVCHWHYSTVAYTAFVYKQWCRWLGLLKWKRLGLCAGESGKPCKPM